MVYVTYRKSPKIGIKRGCLMLNTDSIEHMLILYEHSYALWEDVLNWNCEIGHAKISFCQYEH